MPQEWREKYKVRLYKSICHSFFQLIFYILLTVYTIRDNSGERLLRCYIVFIPESASLALLLIFSRWPDNPCQSLVHLVCCSTIALKGALILFILIKLDGYILWQWSAILW